MPRHWFVFGLACCAALPAAYSLDPKLDTDTWWHMATGRWIVQHGDVPWTDPFSAMSRENPTRWYAYSWLYEVIVYENLIHHDYPGVMDLRTALVAASTAMMFAFLVHRSGLRWQTLLYALLLSMVLMMFAKERPWHLTIVFTTITLWTTCEIRERAFSWRAWLLIPLFALWANIHIQFVVGLLILGLAVACPGTSRRGPLLFLFMGCLLATALNPYHVRLWIVIQEYATQSAARGYITELMPPEWQAPSTWAVIGLLAAALLEMRRGPVKDYFPYILLAVSAILAASMRRDLWLLCLASIAAKPRASARLHPGSAVLAAIIVILLVRMIYAHYFTTPRDYEQANPLPVLIEPAEQLPRHDLPLYNRYYTVFTSLEIASRVIWQRPQHNACVIDGRTNLYGDERIRRFQRSWEDGQWASDPEFIRAEKVIAPIGHAILQYLEAQPELWQRRHSPDPALVIYVRCRCVPSR